MLDRIRRPGRSLKEGSVKKIFSYIVFGLICLVFVFLAPMGSRILGEGVLAYVGDEPIRAGEVQFFENILKQQYQKRLDGADEDSFLKIQKEIRQRALREMINQYLVVQSSKKEGFFVSDKELRSEIRSFPLFQDKGRFLYSRYKLFLKNNRLSASRFEDRIRRDRHTRQWGSLFKKSAVGNHLEKEKNEQRYAYKVRFQYAELKAGELEEEKLEPFVKSRDLENINQFLKKNKLEWKETGEFALISPFGVSIAQNENVMEALIHQLPSRGLIPHFIRQSDTIYIVNVLSFKKKAASLQERQLQNLLSQNFDKPFRLLQSWVDVQNQKIKVKMSDNI